MPDRRTLLVACAAAVAAPRAFAAAAPLDPRYTFRFEWIEGGGAAGASAGSLDVGRVAADAKGIRQRRTDIVRRLAVRIDGPGPVVRLSVALGSETPGATVRLDGVVLSQIPRVIDPAHRVGASVAHQLQLSIPAGMPPGPFLADLQWTADSP